MERFLLYGVLGRPSKSVLPLFVMYGLAVLSGAFLSPLSPEMIKV